MIAHWISLSFNKVFIGVCFQFDFLFDCPGVCCLDGIEERNSINNFIILNVHHFELYLVGYIQDYCDAATPKYKPFHSVQSTKKSARIYFLFTFFQRMKIRIVLILCEAVIFVFFVTFVSKTFAETYYAKIRVKFFIVPS